MSDNPLAEHEESLAQLAAMGVDLSKPRVIAYAIDADDPDVIDGIAGALEESGYAFDVVFDDEGMEDEDAEDSEEEDETSWTVYALVEILPTAEEISSHLVALDAILEPFGCYVSGWATDYDDGEAEEAAQG